MRHGCELRGEAVHVELVRVGHQTADRIVRSFRENVTGLTPEMRAELQSDPQYLRSMIVIVLNEELSGDLAWSALPAMIAELVEHAREGLQQYAHLNL